MSRTFATDVITGGPTYASQYLDIPTDKDGTSVYKGPYVTKGNDTAAYDKAVECDGQKITFHLAKPIGDFNYTVTLGIGAVPKAQTPVRSTRRRSCRTARTRSRPTPRATRWFSCATRTGARHRDDYRPAYPDKIVVKFGLDQSVIDQRMIQDAGADQQAFMRESLLVVRPGHGLQRRPSSRTGGCRLLALRHLPVHQRREGAQPQAPPGHRGRARPGAAAADRRRQLRR